MPIEFAKKMHLLEEFYFSLVVFIIIESMNEFLCYENSGTEESNVPRWLDMDQ